MTSTLFTGLSGLDVNQTKLNVVGNNIANVNTVAFKSSRALFKPQFYVTEGGGSPPDGDFGGTNPNQRGLGAQIASIQKDFTQGAIEPTGKNTDLAIDGEGFFVVQGQGQEFTRDGSFSLNSANQLVSSGGDFVQGYQVDPDFNIVPGRIGNVTIPLGALTSAKATENAYFKGNLNANGAVATGASILTSQPLEVVGGGALASDGSDLLTNIGTSNGTNTTSMFTAGQVFTFDGKKGGRDVPSSTFVVTGTNTVSDLMGFFQQGMGVFTQGTNPDQVPDDGNPATPAPGWTVAASPGDSTNTARLILTGNLGTENSLSIPAGGFFDTSGATPLTFADGVDPSGITSDPAGESVHTSFVGYDSLGTPVTVNVTAVFESSTNQGNTWRYYAESPDDTDPSGILASGTLTFDSSGKLIASNNTSIQVTRDNTGSSTPLSINLDFSNMTSLTSKSSELLMTRQDGNAIGTLNDFSIGADGTITGSFTNGQTRTLGQVAIATFTNPQGLSDKGGNMYTTGVNSGEPVIAAPLTLGSGSIRSGALEQSNVDLSKEFINLIVASTGFSAASRVITTSDQLITELLNSSR
ncbi:MAG TPA: flagellar hook-basal body complex protein [Tepidisphaeraceae bacterium]